jgi:hypothetical protein
MRKTTYLTTAGVMAAFLIGVAAGAGGGDQAADGAAVAKPKPAPTVTATVTETETVTTEVTPQACLDALDLGETAIAGAAEVMAITGEAFTDVVPAAIEAAALWDTEALDATTAQMGALNDRLDGVNIGDPDAYNAAAAACRASN